VVFGHIHQHWQGQLPGRADVPLLGCPSTLCSFAAVQPCPLGRPEDPGGRLVELLAGGGIRQRLLRWSAADPPTVS
jgi:Icc protein